MGGLHVQRRRVDTPRCGACRALEWDYADPDNPGENMFGEPAEFELLNNIHAQVTNKRWNIQGASQNDFNTRFAVRADIYSNEGSEARLAQQTVALKPYWDDYKYPTFTATGETAEELTLIETALNTSYEGMDDAVHNRCEVGRERLGSVPGRYAELADRHLHRSDDHCF